MSADLPPEDMERWQNLREADVDIDALLTALESARANTLAEVATWLIKKAREFHVSSRKAEREQGDTCAILASKIARGAIRPDNQRMLPNPGFFEVDHTYQFTDTSPTLIVTRWTF